MSHRKSPPPTHFMRIGRRNVNCVAIRRAVGAAYDIAVKKNIKLSPFYSSVDDADLQLFLDADDLPKLPTLSRSKVANNIHASF